MPKSFMIGIDRISSKATVCSSLPTNRGLPHCRGRSTMRILCIDRYPYIFYIDRLLRVIHTLHTTIFPTRKKKKRLSDNALRLQPLNLTRIHAQDISEYLIGVLA